MARRGVPPRESRECTRPLHSTLQTTYPPLGDITGGCGSPDLPSSRRRIPGTAPRTRPRHAASTGQRLGASFRLKRGRTPPRRTSPRCTHCNRNRTLGLATPEHTHPNAAFDRLEPKTEDNCTKCRLSTRRRERGSGKGRSPTCRARLLPYTIQGPEPTMILPQVHLR